MSPTSVLPPPLLAARSSQSAAPSPSPLHEQQRQSQRSRTFGGSRRAVLLVAAFGVFLATLAHATAIDQKGLKSAPTASTTTTAFSSALAPASSVSSRVRTARDEIYIDDDSIDGSGRGGINDDLEKDVDYSGSGFGPDDEDASTEQRTFTHRQQPHNSNNNNNNLNQNSNNNLNLNNNNNNNQQQRGGQTHIAAGQPAPPPPPPQSPRQSFKAPNLPTQTYNTSSTTTSSTTATSSTSTSTSSSPSSTSSSTPTTTTTYSSSSPSTTTTSTSTTSSSPASSSSSSSRAINIGGSRDDDDNEDDDDFDLDGHDDDEDFGPHAGSGDGALVPVQQGRAHSGAHEDDDDGDDDDAGGERIDRHHNRHQQSLGSGIDRDINRGRFGIDKPDDDRIDVDEGVGGKGDDGMIIDHDGDDSDGDVDEEDDDEYDEEGPERRPNGGGLNGDVDEDDDDDDDDDGDDEDDEDVDDGDDDGAVGGVDGDGVAAVDDTKQHMPGKDGGKISEDYNDITDPTRSAGNTGAGAGATEQGPGVDNQGGTNIHELDTNTINSLPTDTKSIEHSILNGNDVLIMNAGNDDRTASFFAQPGILAAVIGGAVVGLLCAILIVMFIVYRMRKKDEGSYALDEPKRSPAINSYAKNANNREFYA